MSDHQRDDVPEPGPRGEWLLIATTALLAFLLGSYELFDPDVWWHLRSGQWILAHRRLPRLDIFTFSSADRVWIDLHWGFQVTLALAHALGGVSGMIVLGSLASAAAVAIAVTGRRRGWPARVAVLCWLPALALMATRFDPRPEVFSLVFLAAFLAVLHRVEHRPALVWSLPALQVLWVNAHGLFVLGPIVVGFFWIGLIPRRWIPPIEAVDGPGRGGARLYRQLAPASVAVLLACLANPWGVRGAMFPLELLPKIADPASPYKSYIDEFASLRTAFVERMAASSGSHLHLRLHVFLLLMTAWSFVPPSAWRAAIRGRDARAASRSSPAWAAGLGVACGLALIAAIGLPFPETPAWLKALGRSVPVLVLMAGGVGTFLVRRRSPAAAAIIAVGAAATAAAAAWLPIYLFNGGRPPRGWLASALPIASGGLGLLCALLVVRAGGSPFRLLLAAAFSTLSVLAVRNVNLFGLVAGTVLAWNLAGWLAALATAGPRARPPRVPTWAMDALIVGAMTAWGYGIVTDGYHRLAGEDIHFGFRERPLMFAHQAAGFAGRPGLPPRALAFDLGQAGVYVYHNGPDRKVFMDGRLEVPSLSTFQSYLRIQDRLGRSDPRWDDDVSRLGDPLILIGHEGWSDIEGTILSHPRSRCVYFDEVASVFVPRRGPSSAPGYPDFDFAATHFADSEAGPRRVEPVRAAVESEVLLRLGSILRVRGGDRWRHRYPILIRASDRAKEWLSAAPDDPGPWRLMGLIAWEMAADLTGRPPGPEDPWDPAAGLPWSRATYCFRRALGAAPGDAATARVLAACLGVRRMSEARRQIESRIGGKDRRVDLLGRLERDLVRPPVASSWPDVDRVAAAYMHLGNPRAARDVWAAAGAPTSPARRLSRLAGADLAAFDFRAAEARCREALKEDPRSGEAWYLLCIALLEAGRADEALAACRECIRCEPSPAQRAQIRGIEGFLARRVALIKDGRATAAPGRTRQRPGSGALSMNGSHGTNRAESPSWTAILAPG
jgi:tetratricopeptide (TPR) repeat protein